LINLSIIIPCYNESKSLPRLFDACFSAIIDRNDIEYIFVNNGSNDDTQIVLDQLLSQKEYSLGKSVIIPINKGYGFGILQGLSVAEGRILAWTHADLQTDPKDVILAYESYKVALELNQCIVKGERKGRNHFDNMFTIGMSFVASLLLKQKLWDINAQPKLFHRNSLSLLKDAPNDFSLDLYLLYVASISNYKIYNFPVYFKKREFGEAKGGGTLKGKFKLIKRTISYVFDLKNGVINNF
jgi:glycosyltransferase involved in cell wall biosynthesis